MCTSRDCFYILKANISSARHQNLHLNIQSALRTDTNTEMISATTTKCSPESVIDGLNQIKHKKSQVLKKKKDRNMVGITLSITLINFNPLKTPSAVCCYIMKTQRKQPRNNP